MGTFEVIHSILTGSVLIILAFLWRRSDATTPATLRQRLAELEAAIDRCEHWYKKLNANYALIIARGKRHPEPEKPASEPMDFEIASGETPEQWKRRMRAQIASGGIKHT